jgi:phosphoglycerate dehydrogenase-like enzyme
MPKVVFFTDIAQEEKIVPVGQLSLMASLLIRHAPADFDVSVHSSRLSDDEKISLVKEADFLILLPGQISAPVLKSAPRLKLIQLVSAGYEGMDLNLCRELGVPVANNGGANAIDVAEHTIALILCFYRRLAELDHNVRNNQWRAVDTGRSTYTINGKTAGVIGLGHIGRRVAQLLRVFDARVLYYDKQPPPPETDRQLGITRMTLEALLQASDLVTLHVPLSVETRGLIGQRELGLMKSTTLLVNTCRGPVVDEAALIEALKNQRILGAALDVLEKEPPDSTNPLLTLDNVLLTPHVAGVTYDTWERRGRFIFENLRRVWEGLSPMAQV